MEKIRITSDNIKDFPKFQTLLSEGKIKFDFAGRLRYMHGAPVGDLIKTENGSYKETADEWFDPESQKAKEFVWPQ